MKPFLRVWLKLFQFFALVTIAASAAAQNVRADFSATPIVGCPPMVVNFRDASTGNPTSWRWDLGNGTISHLQHPIGTYFDPGTYTVKLVVRNASNSADSVVRTQYIVVNALPSVFFRTSDSTGCYPLRVQFTDNSTAGSGAITSWQWDFGDGTLSSARSPVHTYTSAGNFTVSLRVTNSNGCVRTFTKPSHIRLTNGVQAGFTSISASGCQPPTPVTFTNTTIGSGAMTYQWNFGDGNTSTQQNPVNNYLNAGSYTVRLIARNSSGCADTLTRTDAINIGSVTARFTAPAQACAGAGITFSNTSTPNTVSSVWYFGDGSTSTEISPVKVYQASGTFQVKLVNDFGSCKDSITRTITITSKPVAAFNSTNAVGCSVPLNVRFTNSSANATSYSWLFGDGGTSTNANPTHTYTVAGTYDVTLIATNSNGCTDTLVRRQFVAITLPRIVAINNLPARGCLPYAVRPVAAIQTAEPITSYYWDFGDGFTSTLDTPSHTYTVAGYYDVKLTIVTASGCRDSFNIARAVSVGTKPVVRFSADRTETCAEIPIQFSDSSAGSPLHEWMWDFGDGGTSSLQNPLYGYYDTGRFNVSLVVSSFGCTDTLLRNFFIHIVPPIAQFDTAFYCNDRLTRRYIDRSKGATSWFWDFGDGTTSTEQNPTHTYAAPGQYSVLQRVTNGTCQHATRMDVLIVKENGALTIDDSVACRNGRVRMDVTNVAKTNIRNYTWFFEGLNGQALVTTNAPVAQTYRTAGTYNVAVITNDILGCNDTLNAVFPLNIYGPRARISGPVPPTCFGSSLTFTSTTVTDGRHPIERYFWYYGDGTNDTATSPPFTHTYDTAGTFTIRLAVIDAYGCKDSVAAPALVTITNPRAGFTISDTLVCPNTPVTFTNTSTGGLNPRYVWNFGDGQTSTTAGTQVHTYATSDSFRIRLNMIDDAGCSDSTSARVRVFSPVANFSMSDSFSSCPPLLVNFSNQSRNFVNYSWDFGDGGNSGIFDPSHTYTYPGSYTVRLWVNNNGGCSDTLRKTVSIQGPSGVFSYTPLVLCNPGEVRFVANTRNTVSYVWDFNDGNTIFTDTVTASHRYTIPGSYLPKMILDDGLGCRVPIVGTDTIKVNAIETNILSDSRVLCDSGYVSFSDTTWTNDAIGSFLWEFGDGTTSTQRSPRHAYNTAGLYTIRMIATSRFGCTDTATYSNYVKVINRPSVGIGGNIEACEPATLTFTGDILRADTSALNWSWDLGNGQTSVIQNPPTQTYVTAGSYTARATVVNSDHCSTTVERPITIHPIPVIDAGVDTLMCRFSPISLQASGGASYTWDFHPSLSCLNCASPSVNPDSLVTYRVSGRSAFGCVGRDSVRVQVRQPLDMRVSNRDTVCVGESAIISASGADFYRWSPSIYLENATSATTRSTPLNTTTYQVIGRDDRNCFSDTASVTIQVYHIPRIEINGAETRTINVGATAALGTTSSLDIVRWRWQPGHGLDCATCPNPVATPRQTTTYSVVASNDGGCVARDEVTITVICDKTTIYVPNTFSPNGDGMNDHFYPRSSGVLTVKGFRVFNRWGQIVYQRNNFVANTATDGWDGTMNGVKLTPDVYVYSMEVICDSGSSFPIKGNVTLIR